MDDVEENAAIVNALQRHADVVVQKSLAEGFGLTVADAMWKQRPVVASRIGGIRDQIEDGRSGVLLSEPRDLEQAGAAITALMADSERRRQNRDRRTAPRPAAVPRPAPPRTLIRGDEQSRVAARAQRACGLKRASERPKRSPPERRSLRRARTRARSTCSCSRGQGDRGDRA